MWGIERRVRQRRVLTSGWLRTMSTKQTAGDGKKESVVQPNRISVEQHAVLRFQTRVDATALNPEERLRSMFRRGHPESTPEVERGKARRCDGYWIVYTGSEANPTIVTVLVAGMGAS